MDRPVAEVRTVELHPSGLPVAVMTVREQIGRNLGPRRCYAWRQTGPAAMGVLAFEVCGKPRNHRGSPRRPGWTGESGGEWWDDDCIDHRSARAEATDGD